MKIPEIIEVDNLDVDNMIVVGKILYKDKKGNIYRTQNLYQPKTEENLKKLEEIYEKVTDEIAEVLVDLIIHGD